MCFLLCVFLPLLLLLLSERLCCLPVVVVFVIVFYLLLLFHCYLLFSFLSFLFSFLFLFHFYSLFLCLDVGPVPVDDLGVCCHPAVVVVHPVDVVGTSHGPLLLTLLMLLSHFYHHL